MSTRLNPAATSFHPPLPQLHHPTPIRPRQKLLSTRLGISSPTSNANSGSTEFFSACSTPFYDAHSGLTPPVPAPAPTMNHPATTTNTAANRNQTAWGAQSEQRTAASASATLPPPTYAGTLLDSDFGGPFGLAPPNRYTARTYPYFASQPHPGFGSPNTRTQTQGMRDRSRGGSRSGSRRRPSESAFAHKKRYDQGPLPSGADVYPVDAGYVNPGGRPAAVGAVPMWTESVGRGGGGAGWRAPELSEGSERRADWRYTTEEDSGARYGITMGGLGNGGKWLRK